MIRLYCIQRCADCIEYELALKEMVMAHEVIWLDEAEYPSSLPPELSLPVLQDSKAYYSGPEAIRDHLKALAKFSHDWHVYQGDACYIRE